MFDGVLERTHRRQYVDQQVDRFRAPTEIRVDRLDDALLVANQHVRSALKAIAPDLRRGVRFAGRRLLQAGEFAAQLDVDAFDRWGIHVYLLVAFFDPDKWRIA